MGAERVKFELCAPAIDTSVINNMHIIYPVRVTKNAMQNKLFVFRLMRILIIYSSKDKLRVDLRKSSPEWCEPELCRVSACFHCPAKYPVIDLTKDTHNTERF